MKKILLTMLDIVFPRDPCVLLADTLTDFEFEKHITKAPLPLIPHCAAFLPYKNTVVRHLIHASKYHGHARAPTLLAHATAPFVAEELSERRLFGAFHTPLLTAIPLHEKRQRERGFNQSRRIAEALIEKLGDEGIEARFDVLMRVKHTPPQTHRIDKHERIANMKHAFSVSTPHAVYGREVLLIDDVVTTGATFLEARAALMKVGAKDVLCIAVAH